MEIRAHPRSCTSAVEVIQSPELGAQPASTYRSAVGILLYLWCDMVQCQWMIRHLADSMSKPTLKAWTELRHLDHVGLRKLWFDDALSK